MPFPWFFIDSITAPDPLDDDDDEEELLLADDVVDDLRCRLLLDDWLAWLLCCR